MGGGGGGKGMGKWMGVIRFGNLDIPWCTSFKVMSLGVQLR